MFWKFYFYIVQTTARKKSIWIVSGLIWLFYSLILFIIPSVLDVNPLFLWTNSMVNFNTMSSIFISIYAGILAETIFSLPKEDGSELVIFSKPIARWKIINAKFLAFFTFVLINIAVDLIIPLFCLCLGVYDPTNNPSGIDVSKFGSLEISIFAGILVISLFFGSIGILVSMKGSKNAVLITTIAMANVFYILCMALTIIIKSPADIATDRHGISIVNGNFYDRDKARAKCFMTQDDGIISDEINFEKCTSDWNNQVEKESMLQFYNTINIATQMGSIFRLGSLDDSKNADINIYGFNSTNKYITNPSWQIFDPYDPKIEPTQKDAFIPIIYPQLFDEYWGYNIFGLDQNYYMIYQSVGATPESVFCIDNTANKLKSKFVNSDEFGFINSNGEDVVREHKNGTGQYEANGAYEYAMLRNELINYVRDKNTPMPKQDDLVQEIYNFLCKPLHSYSDKSLEIASSGLEATIGIDITKVNSDTDFAVAFGKVELNLMFDMWDLFYGKNIDRFQMSEDVSDPLTAEWFTKHLTKDLEDKGFSTWHLYNGTDVSTTDYVQNYRFMFYKDFLNNTSLLNPQISDTTTFDRFYNIVGLGIFQVKNQAAYIIPINITDPKPIESDTLQINTFRTHINSIRQLVSGCWYEVRRYIPNSSAITFWACFSGALFCSTFIIYRRTDIK